MLNGDKKNWGRLKSRKLKNNCPDCDWCFFSVGFKFAERQDDIIFSPLNWTLKAIKFWIAIRQTIYHHEPSLPSAASCSHYELHPLTKCGNFLTKCGNSLRKCGIPLPRRSKPRIWYRVRHQWQQQCQLGWWTCWLPGPWHRGNGAPQTIGRAHHFPGDLCGRCGTSSGPETL